MIAALLTIFRNHAALQERVTHLEAQLALAHRNAARAAKEHQQQLATLHDTINSQRVRCQQLHNAADNLANEMKTGSSITRGRALAHWRSIR